MKDSSIIEKHYRACNLCEAICGLIIEHQNDEILSIKGDPDDPLSKGHICPKALALQDINNDPNRLKKPIKRIGNDWEEISWKQAYLEVGENIRRLQKEFGNDSIALYQGNPSVHNYGTLLFGGELRKALNTKNKYSATSLDQLPHQYVSQLMFGHELLIPIPDIDRTDFFLVIGANPLVSNGSMMTAPGMARRIKNVQKRNGKVVVIDPRRTETALKADQHLFIKPESDVFLLLALLNEVFKNEWVNLKEAASYTLNLDQVRDLVQPYTPENVESITGIDVSSTKLLAKEFTQADAAVCYGRMGVSVQEFGTLCQWLINVLNIVTGNFDRPGGHMFTTPAVQVIRGKLRSTEPRWHSRVSKRPEIIGELPTAVLSEEIATEGQGKVRGLIVSSGNPVVSGPNGGELSEALKELDYMVAIDIYINDTTRNANIILPPATGLEVDHYDLVFNSFAVRNTAKYSPPLFTPEVGSQYDWQIFRNLARTIKPTASIKTKILDWWKTPARLLNIGLKTGSYAKSHSINLKKLMNNPSGIDLGALKSIMPGKLYTKDKTLDLAPEILVAGMNEVVNKMNEDDITKLKLISRRNLRSNNSWMQGIERLSGGSNKCTLQMNPHDAEIYKVHNESPVVVSSKQGSIDVILEVTDAMMPGVVSLPHGWSKKDGEFSANINMLTSNSRLDKLSGNTAFSGLEVEVCLKKTGH